MPPSDPKRAKRHAGRVKRHNSRDGAVTRPTYQGSKATQRTAEVPNPFLLDGLELSQALSGELDNWLTADTEFDVGTYLV
jgi:hypothetical protein